MGLGHQMKDSKGTESIASDHSRLKPAVNKIQNRPPSAEYAKPNLERRTYALQLVHPALAVLLHVLLRCGTDAQQRLPQVPDHTPLHGVQRLVVLVRPPPRRCDCAHKLTHGFRGHP